MLKIGTAEDSRWWAERFEGRLNVTVATPIADCAGHSLRIAVDSSFFGCLANCASVHCANGVGLPTNPAGSSATTSWGNPTLRGCSCASGGAELNVTTFVTWKGCDPAWVSIFPPTPSGIS